MNTNPFKKSVYGKTILFLAFVSLFILALTAMCTTVSAVEGGCPSETQYHDTIHGGVYFKFYWVWPGEELDINHYKASATFFDLPDKEKIKVARLYTGVWGGSPGKGGKFNITFNGNLSTDYTACDPCPGGPCDDYEGVTGNGARCNVVNETECHAYVTGCNVMYITYDVLNDIVTGTNTATTESDCDPACSGACRDNRIYHLALLVVYEDASMPEITYWIKEGSPYLINGSSCVGDADEMYIHFNGSAYPGSVSDMKYWIAGVPGLPEVDAELNGKPIAACDFEDTSYCKRWDNIPASYLNPSSNLFYYYHPDGGYDRVNAAVLVLNLSEPANLTVTNISPQSLYADPDETGGYANVINATVLNSGKTAYFFDVTLYANDTKVDVKRVTDLGEGESRVVSFLWAPNATASYELNVTADVENVVNETDETNNSKTLDVTVTEAQPPAWQSQSSSPPETISNGGTIELKAQGNAEIGLDNAILATDETGTWMNCTGYGSPLDMASSYNYFITHTTDADWNNQTIERQPGFRGNPLLKVSGGDVKLAQVTAGTENLALNKPAYASSHETAYEPDYYYLPSYANDGDPGGDTFWASNATLPGTPQWWYVDLEEVTVVTKVVLDFTGYNANNKYEILTSNDGTNWETQIERNYGKDETFTNLDWSCQYINVTTYEGFGSDTTRARIQEFEVYGPGDYASNGTLTSSTIETSNPVVAVIPEWNSTELAETNLSVNVSVDNGATWKPAVKGTELTWDYNVYNTSLKYKVLFETTNLSRTPNLHDITLNYKTRDPIESEWLWSNFAWQNSSITDRTVNWRIYYEDMLGNTNCTDVMSFDVGTGGDKSGPVTTNVVAEPNPTNGANIVTLTANVDDSTTSNSIIVAAEYFVDTVGSDGTGTAMSASDGAFDSVTEAVTANIDVSGWAIGNYTLYVHGKDTAGNWGATESVVLEVTEAGGEVEDKAKEDIPVKGDVTGTYVNTHASDDMCESITEVLSGGKPADRHSYLEHKWSIDVTGDSDFVFYLEAHHSPSTDGDDFEFAYSKSVDGTYTPMVTVTKTTDDGTYQTYTFTESITGTVYIRVQDTNRDAGKQELNTVYIDHMYIKSKSGSPSYGVTVTIDEASQKVKPGESTTYTVRVKNTGGLDASYSVAMTGTAVDESTIDVSPHDWNTGTLAPNTENITTVTVFTTASTPETTYTLTATATCVEDASVTDSATSELVVSSAQYNEDKANTDIPVKGDVTGTYVNTHASDNGCESITEVLSGGKPANRYSLLEHKWTIDVTGDSDFVFYVEGYHSPSTDGDDFEFAYSKSLDGTYIPMLTVTKTADDDAYQTYTFTESITGTVYIRVQDTNWDAGKQELNTVYIDHMYIKSKSGSPSYGVTVTIDEASQTVKPGESTTYTVRVKNTGGLDASYNVVMSGTAVDETTITVSPLNWNTGTLAPNTENMQTVTVSTTSSTPETTYTLIATATCEQDASVTDSATSELVVSSASYTDDKAKEDIPVKGTVSGSYVDTQTSNDGYESIKEVLSGGKPGNRYSYLEHKWSIDVTGGSTVTFYVEAHHSSSTDGDDFEFAYSKSVDGTYTPMVTVTKTADNDAYQTYTFTEPISGTVYVRVQDTNWDAGKQELNTVYIDHMFIRSE